MTTTAERAETAVKEVTENTTQIQTAQRIELSESIDSIELLEGLPLELRTEIEAAAFRRLVSHLQSRTDAQNIDLMNLAGFCRNCLSKWYRAEAEKRNVKIEDLVAREHVYGMPYSVWKRDFQK